MKLKMIMSVLAVAMILVGWGVTWANQNAKIKVNKSNIEVLSTQVNTVSSQATEADKAIVRIETKIEFILQGIEEIKVEIKGKYKIVAK